MDVASLIEKEEKRQSEGLELIPSENIMFPQCREILGSVLTNKYSEGYPGKRYYAGNFVIDEIEQLAINRVKKLFNVEHANVQAHSGSPANLAISLALAGVGGKMLSQHLNQGGHLSMGQEASFTSKIFDVEYYGLNKDGEVDWEELERKAIKFKPVVIWSGGTAYTKVFKFEKYAKIADKVGAYFIADISHIGGLVAAGTHPSPVDFAHVVMTTTHKTLRGPWGALIMVTEKGLKKDTELSEKIDKAVFPGLQGGPHMANIAAIAEMAKLAGTKDFKDYSRQVVENASVIAKSLINDGYDLVGGGTKNHMIWIDLTNKNVEGWVAHVALEAAGLYTNKQTTPNDPNPPFYPSGLRLGTPTMTTRGMKNKEAKIISGFIDKGIVIAKALVDDEFPDIGSKHKGKDQEARRKFKEAVKENRELKKLSQEVLGFCRKHSL